MERPAGAAPPPCTPSRLFIGTATRSCATPPLPQHRTRRQQKHHQSTQAQLGGVVPPPILSATQYLLLPGYYRSCCTFATTTTTHLCYRYHYTHYGHPYPATTDHVAPVRPLPLVALSRSSCPRQPPRRLLLLLRLLLPLPLLCATDATH